MAGTNFTIRGGSVGDRTRFACVTVLHANHYTMGPNIIVKINAQLVDVFTASRCYNDNDCASADSDFSKCISGHCQVEFCTNLGECVHGQTCGVSLECKCKYTGFTISTGSKDGHRAVRQVSRVIGPLLGQISGSATDHAFP